jgi:hypothetical protein
MGQGRALAALLIGALSLGAASGTTLPFRAARWTVPDPLALQSVFAVRNAECVAASSVDRRSLDVGYVAFRTPLLLGGQAARAGLSCNSCHREGRGNPQFLFVGISGEPGTADVTSSLVSRKRGDGTHNPVPIPDLATPPFKISRSDPGKLEGFIRGLIVEEFDGAEPGSTVLAGLAGYIRALNGPRCEGSAPEPVSLARDVADYLRSMEALKDALANRDVPTAILMLHGARTALGVIDERFAVAGGAEARAVLAREDRRLARLLAKIRSNGLGVVQPDVKLLNRLASKAEQSLYNPVHLSAAIGASGRQLAQ